MASEESRRSALPSTSARIAAFVAILIAGLSGGLIGYAFVNVQCVDECSTASGVGAIVGALLAAGGVAVVSVLALRAMGEWRRVSDAAAATEDARRDLS